MNRYLFVLLTMLFVFAQGAAQAGVLAELSASLCPQEAQIIYNSRLRFLPDEHKKALHLTIVQINAGMMGIQKLRLENSLSYQQLLDFFCSELVEVDSPYFLSRSDDLKYYLKLRDNAEKEMENLGFRPPPPVRSF